MACIGNILGYPVYVRVSACLNLSFECSHQRSTSAMSLLFFCVYRAGCQRQVTGVCTIHERKIWLHIWYNARDWEAANGRSRLGMRRSPPRNPLKIPCIHCPKRFESQACLNGHMQAHVTEDRKKYVCDFCEEGYVRGISLRNHRETHNRALVRTCNRCSYRASNWRTLMIHLKGCRVSSPVFLCIQSWWPTAGRDSGCVGRERCERRKTRWLES